jgi:hypothetical protein
MLTLQKRHSQKCPRILPQQFDYSADARSALVFILARRVKTERLAHVLLVDPKLLPRDDHTVIAFDDDRDLIPKSLNAGIGHYEAAGPRQFQAEVLVLGMTIPFACRRFENVSCRRPPGWDAPSSPVIEKPMGPSIAVSVSEM